jgi:hypothetical protein
VLLLTQIVWHPLFTQPDYLRYIALIEETVRIEALRRGMQTERLT